MQQPLDLGAWSCPKLKFSSSYPGGEGKEEMDIWEGEWMGWMDLILLGDPQDGVPVVWNSSWDLFLCVCRGSSSPGFGAGMEGLVTGALMGSGITNPAFPRGSSREFLGTSLSAPHGVYGAVSGLGVVRKKRFPLWNIPKSAPTAAPQPSSAPIPENPSEVWVGGL